MLQLNHVVKRYPGGIDALDRVSFSLAKGEMACLTGPSGAGKSTLFRLISLMERPTQGQIVFDKQNLHGLASRKIPYVRRKLGLIFQDYKLLEQRTVFENVALPLLVSGYAVEEIRNRVHASLDLVNLLDKSNRRPPALSGGEQQRVGIARALVHKPQLIIADEPTGNLDSKLAWEIMKLFVRLQQVGISILIASHDQYLIKKIGCRVLVLKQGVLIRDSADKSSRTER
ncbi:MAG: cell division ATP-binding protein FtsE [Gammaproteobacteria bacterium]|nr:cell division ATP-binding protein FtsE [Gammaproteobacteria bacterium]